MSEAIRLEDYMTPENAAKFVGILRANADEHGVVRVRLDDGRVVLLQLA